MKVLIVHAHPEPQSFNGGLTRHAVSVLTQAGHEVKVSDLYAMGWDPVSDRRNFTTAADPDVFRQQDEEAYAVDHQGFSPDIRAEMEKLEWCDTLILQFPLWWFSVPAILKGWIDRVLAYGFAYGGGRWYDHGAFAGKRALLSLTTGGPWTMYAADGLHGEIDAVLYPLNHGVLRFTGFDVLPPFVAYAVNRGGEAGRAASIEAYKARLLSLETTEPIAYPPITEFDADFRRRAAIAVG